MGMSAGRMWKTSGERTLENPIFRGEGDQDASTKGIGQSANRGVSKPESVLPVLEAKGRNCFK